MTKLSERKSRLRFTTDAEIRYRGKMRPVVIEVDNGYTATVRLGGTRQRYEFSWHGFTITLRNYTLEENENAKRRNVRNGEN